MIFYNNIEYILSGNRAYSDDGDYLEIAGSHNYFISTTLTPLFGDFADEYDLEAIAEDMLIGYSFDDVTVYIVNPDLDIMEVAERNTISK